MSAPRSARFLLAAAVCISLTACGAGSSNTSAANCPVESSSLFVLMAQSVPSATLLPCIATLPAGWSYGGSDIRSDRARLWLDSDRAGIHAVEISLDPSCSIAGAMDVTNATEEAGVRVFIEEFGLHPFSANRYFLFPGGCVTYRYRFQTKAEPVLALEADQAVTFGLRTAVVQDVQRELGLTLCGVGAPPCPDDA